MSSHGRRFATSNFIMTPFRTLLLAFAFALTPAAAQVVERPVPFDSAGRLMVVTPSMVARMELLPPVWQITGDFSEARLFDVGAGTYVLVVTRPNGAVERYPMSGDDVSYLRARASRLPPALVDDLRTSSGVRRDFLINQSLIGAFVYAPAFSLAVTNDDAGRLATYLLIAGGTYFGAATLSREIEITGPMNSLATHMALHGGAMGFGTAYALDAQNDGRAAGTFAGALLGTASGLYFGRGLTSGEARAMGFGADALALTTLGVLHVDEKMAEDGPTNRDHVAILVGAGAVGYALGLNYARRATYNITAGDISTLWISGGIGAVAALSTVTNGDRDLQTDVPVATAGFIVGLIAGDRLLVRRFDHSVAEGTTVALGAGAGGLMGMGVGVLIDRDNEALSVALAALGAVGGVAATERIFPPSGDAGRSASRVRFHPMNAGLAALGVPGRLPVLSIAF